jgi:hypothetical protein
MFWFKKRKILIDRDEVAEVFMRHCRQEADKLLAAIIPALRDFCDGGGGRPSFENVMSQQRPAFRDGQFQITSGSLIACHCYATALAVGLDALHIDPFDVPDVLEWMIYRSIIGEDVGPDNVGSPPSPWRDRMHVQCAPGTFENGLPSLQKQLTDHYRRRSAFEKAVILLMALRVFRPRHGVSKVRYQRTHLQGGLVSLNRIGTEPLGADDLDGCDLQISTEALDRFPPDVLKLLISALSAVDPFWPTFGKSHQVMWR